MSICRRTAWAMLATLAALPALAGSPAGSFMQRIAGEWQGAGEVNRMAADIRMHWETVLDGAFRRLSLRNRMTGQEGKAWEFEAHGYYRVADDGTIAGSWFDSRGISLPLIGRVEGEAMVIDWGTEASPERGRSTYRLTAEGLEVTDEVYGKDGSLTVFGRTRLKRKSGTLP